MLMLACGGGAPAQPKSNTSEISGARFLLYPMMDKYKGEEGGGGHYGTVIKYLDETERLRHVMHGKDGKLVDPDGKPLDPQIGSAGADERSGFAIYVMTGDGTVYVSFDHNQGSFHHSSLVAGAPVAGAGDMTIIDGELLELSNSSGHYRPPPESLKNVATRFTEMGIDMSGVKITRVGEQDR
jgi:hypothetical protein